MVLQVDSKSKCKRARQPAKTVALKTKTVIQGRICTLMCVCVCETAMTVEFVPEHEGGRARRLEPITLQIIESHEYLGDKNVFLIRTSDNLGKTTQQSRATRQKRDKAHGMRVDPFVQPLSRHFALPTRLVQ
jgi:hypothetical protein